MISSGSSVSFRVLGKGDEVRLMRQNKKTGSRFPGWIQPACGRKVESMKMKNRKIRAKNWISFAAVFVICLLLLLPTVLPVGHIVTYQVPEESPSAVLSMEDVTEMNDCELQGDTFTATGSDPYVVLGFPGGGAKTVVLYDNAHSEKELQVYYDFGGGFSETNSRSVSVDPDGQLIFALKEQKFSAIRYDFKKQFSFRKAEAYPTVSCEEAAQRISTLSVTLVAVLSLLAAAVFLLADVKWGLTDRFLGCLRRNRKRTLLFLLFTVLLFAAALLAELLLGLILLHTGVNIFRMYYLFTLFMVVFEFLFFRKSVAKLPERLFLALCLTIGMAMIVVTPIGHTSWDVETHYYFAVRTTGWANYYTEADETIMYNPVGTLPSESAEVNVDLMKTLNEKDYYASSAHRFYPSIAHFPSGIAMKFARFLGLPFSVAFAAGKLPNLLIYSLLCYYAIKKLKSGKMILSVLALFPTALFLASNYSYDYWVIGFALLGYAYFFSEYQQKEKPISVWDQFIMCGAMVLACIPKPVYFPIMALPLFMPRKKLPRKKQYYALCVVSFAVIIAVLLLRAFLSFSGGGDARGGSGVSSTGQLQFILWNPLTYTKILLQFMREYLSIPTMSSYTTMFAYLGSGAKYYYFVILLMLTAATDKNEYDETTSKLWMKGLVLLLFLGTTAIVATSLYMAFTPVGNDAILGCQPRYLLPLIFPVAYVMGSGKIRNGINRTAYNMAVYAPCSALILYNIYQCFLSRMM